MFKKFLKRLKNCEGCRSRRQWIYRWIARGKLIRRYEYLNEVNKLMELYLTRQILNGGSQEFISKSRSALVDKQQEIKSTDNMIDFLRSL